MLTGYGSITSAVEALRAGRARLPEQAGGRRSGAGRLERRAGAHEEPPVSPSLARAEWEHIQRVLADCNQNISEAARRLEITRRTLQLKLKKYPPRA